MTPDSRRRIPATDALLDLAGQSLDLGAPHVHARVKALINDLQAAARRGEIPGEELPQRLRAALRDPPGLRPVLNATGVVVHTNLGRAPLSEAATEAVVAAAGYVDVELDLATGARAPRGEGARAALLRACPAAEDALIVNNGAAALILAITALAGTGEVIVSRGELVEIGGGFRLPELLTATGATLREVGTTNRTHASDYTAALGPRAAAVLKVHPSNFTVSGFTAAVDLADLAGVARPAGLPLIADLGSGLLHPEPALPEEPDVTAALGAGADLVIVSGDKLLGGPQAGIVLGRADLIARLRSHPLARAVRADKLTFAALEATLNSPQPPPVTRALAASSDQLRARTEALAAQVGGEVVRHEGRVGGGGAPGVALAGWALRLPEHLAARLRTGSPPVLARTHGGACLIDLRCVPPAAEPDLVRAIHAALNAGPGRA